MIDNTGYEQIGMVKSWVYGLGCTISIDGDHNSQGHKLPVIRVSKGSDDIYLRNNFYDWNIGVDASAPIKLDYDEYAERYDKEWYEAEIARSRGYRWESFSNSEMDALLP